MEDAHYCHLVIKVGLTGGIGAGKSEVARRLAQLGAVVVDADALARESLAPGRAELAAVAAEFGEHVLAPDGSLDRAALGRVVFGDRERLDALEAIVHPYVERRSAELIAAAPPDAVVVYDVPLLAEKQMQGHFDVVVVVLASEAVRMQRLVAGRGMTESDALQRIRAQAHDDQRREVADVVILNDRDLVALEQQIVELWERLSRLR